MKKFMPKKPSETLYNEIIKQGISYIDEAITKKTAENYYLDFKATEKSDYSGQRTLFSQDQKNYGKAISAFGNSEGGVIVWGVNTGTAEADYASSKAPIKNASNFLALLESFASLLTSPPHPNISSKVIFEDEKKDMGYVVTHIPKSGQRPFQMIKESRYYIRAGSSSLPAPDTFLRSLFGREPQPDVFSVFGVQPAEIEADGTIKIKTGIILINRGESVAKNVNGYVHVGGLGMGLEPNQNTANDFSYSKNTITGLKVGFIAKPHFILGIEQEVQPLFMYVQIKKPITENGIQIYTLISCDNQMSYRGEIVVSKEKLEESYDRYMKDQSYNIAEDILKKIDTEKI